MVSQARETLGVTLPFAQLLGGVSLAELARAAEVLDEAARRYRAFCADG